MSPSDSGILRPIAEGECIYCQGTSKELTEEHVIPVGLGGTRTLKNASCEKCRRITHRFETTALRHVLGPGRYWLGIRARKLKARPRSWPAYKTTEGGQTEKIDIPIDDLPFFMCLPTYKINSAITGSIPDEHIPSRRRRICDSFGGPRQCRGAITRLRGRFVLFQGRSCRICENAREDSLGVLRFRVWLWRIHSDGNSSYSWRHERLSEHCIK